MAKLVFDESNITIGDLEDFEDAVGLSLQEALKTEKVRDEETGKIVRDAKGRPVEAMNISAKAMKGLVWIVARQSNPDFTLEDARAVRVTELEIVDSDADDDSAPKESADIA